LAALQVAFRPDPRDRRVLRAGGAAAYGAPAEGVPDSRDVLLLRLLAEHLSADGDDRLGVLSSAVAARLALRSGQVGEARALLRVHPAAVPLDAGLLRWVDGDALLALGDLPGAHAAWASAEEHLLRGRLEARAEGRTERWGVVGEGEEQRTPLRGAERAHSPSSGTGLDRASLNAAASSGVSFAMPGKGAKMSSRTRSTHAGSGRPGTTKSRRHRGHTAVVPPSIHFRMARVG